MPERVVDQATGEGPIRLAVVNAAQRIVLETLVEAHARELVEPILIGATGAVLTIRLLHSMQRDGLARGIVTLCIGGGQAVALALEMVR